MTSSVSSVSCADIFEVTEFLINKQFDLILESVNKRRIRLITELKNLKAQWHFETEKHFQAIQKLDSMRKGIEALCIKDNQFSHIHNASLNPVLQELAIHRNRIKQPKIFLHHCDVKPIIELTNNLGELRITDRETEPALPKTVAERRIMMNPASTVLKSYRTKHHPESTIQNRGCRPGQFTDVKNLFFCETNNRLFIVSESEHKVLSFTLEGGFVSEFGDKILKRPCDIFVNYDNAFVTDESLLGICSFSSRGLLARQLIHSFAARGIVGDNENQKLYVTDPIANCVCVFNFLLVRMKIIEFSRPLNLPMEIQLYHNVLFLMAPGDNDKCLVTFKTDGLSTQSLIPRAYLQDNSTPVHFCIDSFGNFILSECSDSQLKVFSSGGEFFCTIGRQKEGIPKSVCVANDKIVCAMPGGVVSIF